MATTNIIINEEWRSINGFINYQVSNIGRVRNANTGRILKPGGGTGGYLKVELYKNGKQFTYRIHKLVANEFLDNPENKSCVDHISGNRTDNRVINLRWATYSDNNRNKSKKQNTSSQYYGVFWDRHNNKWKCQTRDIIGKVKHLGYFINEKEAAQKYNDYICEHFQEFGKLNQID